MHAHTTHSHTTSLQARPCCTLHSVLASLVVVLLYLSRFHICMTSTPCASAHLPTSCARGTTRPPKNTQPKVIHHTFSHPLHVFFTHSLVLPPSRDGLASLLLAPTTRVLHSKRACPGLCCVGCCIQSERVLDYVALLISHRWLIDTRLCLHVRCLRGGGPQGVKHIEKRAQVYIDPIASVTEPIKETGSGILHMIKVSCINCMRVCGWAVGWMCRRSACVCVCVCVCVFVCVCWQSAANITCLNTGDVLSCT